MLDIDKLQSAMSARGYNKGKLTQALGKSNSWYSQKVNTKKISLGEADQIVDVLKLGGREAQEIFFSQCVAEMQQT